MPDFILIAKETAFLGLHSFPINLQATSSRANTFGGNVLVNLIDQLMISYIFFDLLEYK